ncbi:cation:proton antiporter [Kiloniella sp. EL199]|uniref:cation:proton antiporter n=1 Tax=Kiloniella sp. EL199 TaxID=2107581 RepID=UPI000EA2AB3D|nr:cation:proton antiporter [Kiloniella sp. EL199]
MPVSDIVLTISALLIIIACTQPLARRSGLPFTVVLGFIGVLIASGANWLLHTRLTDQFNDVAALVVNIPISSSTFLDILLPILLFQGAITIDVRRLAKDIIPIIFLAVLGVFVAIGLIGGAVSLVSSAPLIVCLLFGAIVATTDPSAVIALFRDLGAPARLTRLVEGESLLNDATAIAAFSAFLTLIISGGGYEPGLLVKEFGVSFLGGIITGAIFGRLAIALISWLGSFRAAQLTITVALPFIVYTLANNYIHISGVIAVVTSGLVLSAMARSRFQSETFTFFLETLDQLAWWAGGLVFVLAALMVPDLLSDFAFSDLIVILVAVVAALFARAAILFGIFPLLTLVKITQRVNNPTKTVIIWGGLRGAVTLALALSVTENPLIDNETQRFIAIQATGFALFTLLIQGPSLTPLMKWLKLDQLSPIERAFRTQVLSQSLSTVKSSLTSFANRFELDPKLVELTIKPYSNRLSTVTEDKSYEEEISDKDRLVIGLVALANQEKTLLFEQRLSGVLRHELVDQYLLVVENMIDSAREDGRLGYLNAAKKPYRHTPNFLMLGWCQTHLGLNRPLASHLGKHFQFLLISRILVMELEGFLDNRLCDLLGPRPVEVLHEILNQRLESIERHLAALRLQYPKFARTLDQRILERFAYQDEIEQIETLRESGIISDDLSRSLKNETNSIHVTNRSKIRVDIKATTAELLSAFPVFSNLSHPELKEIAKKLQPRVLADGAYVFRKGDSADGLYFIESGAVEIRVGDELHRLGHGDFFGEMALLDEAHRSADVKSISYSHLLLLEKETFQELARSHPSWRSALSDIATKRKSMNDENKSISSPIS